MLSLTGTAQDQEAETKHNQVSSSHQQSCHPCRPVTFVFQVGNRLMQTGDGIAAGFEGGKLRLRGQDTWGRGAKACGDRGGRPVNRPAGPPSCTARPSSGHQALSPIRAPPASHPCSVLERPPWTRARLPAARANPLDPRSSPHLTELPQGSHPVGGVRGKGRHKRGRLG